MCLLVQLLRDVVDVQVMGADLGEELGSEYCLSDRSGGHNASVAALG